jgi:hypothetical protein
MTMVRSVFRFRFVSPAILAASILAASLATTLLASGSASGAEIVKLRVGNWNGGAFSNDSTGKFSHCAASARYKSGITLLFSVTADRVWSMGFSSPTWQLTPNTTYPVRYRVDEGQYLEGRAVAKNNQLAQVFLPANDSLFAAFRLGGMLRVEAEKQTLLFRLTDTVDLLAALLRCARDHNTAGAGNTNPFGGGNARPSPAPAPSNPFGSGTPATPQPRVPAPANAAPVGEKI